VATSAVETKQDLKRILVVDDEPNINDLISTSLKFSGFEVRSAMNGAQALTIAEEFKPHALVLDVMMPGMSGFQVCEKLRKDGLKVGVLFLTAKDSTDDKVTGLTIGGDDYMVKPFSLEELIARVRAILRRTGDIEIDIDDELIRFADLELNEILDHVWQYDFRGDAGIVETYISYLRKKIDIQEPQLIHTVRGVGYRLRLPSKVA